ncbi:hypothetical protein [Marinobacterium stanieri]|uniref:hypothetical protein n=1 Tax=Marinobacterium stanieri TaxID=49186 RepID=UPI000255A0E8|nr:hypothetical protein [Marinobacterium stanieri]
MDIDAISDAAANFRLVVEEQYFSLGLESRSFPRGACGYMTHMLGAYLHDQGLGVFEYIGGERGFAINDTWSTHAWLCGDGVIVDITADQFEDVDEPVIVTRKSKWHEKFRTKSYGQIYIEALKDSLVRPYGKIMRALEERANKRAN